MGRGITQGEHMAHIPQDASYVNPPAGIEVNEAWVTDEALALLDNRAVCWCGYGVMTTDDEWEAGKRDHAESCDRLRALAIDALYGEAE